MHICIANFLGQKYACVEKKPAHEKEAKSAHPPFLLLLEGPHIALHDALIFLRVAQPHLLVVKNLKMMSRNIKIAKISQQVIDD